MKKIKTNIFSIYLLKDGFNDQNSLKNNHSLKKNISATRLPKGAVLYIADNEPKEPWWKAYWGITDEIMQSLKGAVVFIPIDNRYFAVTFGHAYHQLRNEAFEYNFGLITSLNALDPEKIKSADIASPENAMQHRSQSPAMEHWTYFDVVQDDSIIKKLQGQALDQYKDLFVNVSGSDSFRFGSKSTPQDLPNLCKKLLTLFLDDSYKQNFPNILNVQPVKDPDVLANLEEELLSAFYDSDIKLTLAIPEITTIAIAQYSYQGQGRSEIYDDVYIDDYRGYLQSRGIDFQGVTLEALHKHRIKLLDNEKETKTTYSIFRCMIFDCAIGKAHYHLFDGQWFEIEKDYLLKLKKSLDPYFKINSRLLPCTYKNEEDYNINVAKSSAFICLDQTNISVSKRDKIEPCDLLSLENEKVNLMHIKISTRSANLSHLFKQGTNSLEILRLEPKSKDALKKLVEKSPDIVAKIEENQYSLTFGIITAKKSSMKSDALPIFSRISLMAALRQCTLSNTQCSVVLIEDKYSRTKVLGNNEV